MELWIPYGPVETLLTIQVENLAELVDPKAEDRTKELTPRITERLKGCQKVIVCDQKRPTLKVLKSVFSEAQAAPELRIFSRSPREIESAIPQLKGRVSKLSDNMEKLTDEGGVALSIPQEIRDASNKLIVATAEPDPLFGLVDARVAGCLLVVANSRRLAYAKAQTGEPRVLQQNPAYETLANLSSSIPGASYLSVVPRGGEPYALIEEAGVEKAKAEFVSMTLSPAKGAVIAPGGGGYDDTLSHALRSIWSAIECVRKLGEILLIAECRDGIGSESLQMYLTGRISDEKLDRIEYAEGLEEVEYLRRLKNDYSVTLLSTLPEVYIENKLRFRMTNAATEGLKKILSSVGKSSKMHVVTRACETLLIRA